MKRLSLILLAVAALAAGTVAAQTLPADSIYQLQARVTDAQGRELDWSALRGQPRLLSMFYTHCHLMCPLIIENGKALQKQLPASERERLVPVMISLDPARDTPAALRETMQRHRLPAQWQFLAPAPNDVRAIASLLDIRYRARDDGSINHTSTWLLVDADGRVLARSEVAGAAPDPAFVGAVRQALATPAPSRP